MPRAKQKKKQTKKTKKKTKSKVKSKSKKVQSKKDIIKIKKQPGTAGYEKKLLKMREDFSSLIQNKSELELSTEEVGDEADIATRSSERELLFELSDSERQTLDAIEAALRKIETGHFGVCEACSKKIKKQRLHAIPHARYCIQCQARFESPR